MTSIRGTAAGALALALSLSFGAAAPAPPAPRPAAKAAAAPAKAQPAASSAAAKAKPAASSAAAKPTARRAAPAASRADGWTQLLAGKGREAEEMFAARLAARPADLSAAIGLASSLEARDDLAGAQLTLVRALLADPPGPEAAGAFAMLVGLSPRAPDGGGAALQLYDDIAAGRRLAAVPDARAMAFESLAGVLARRERPAEGFARLVGDGGRATAWTLVGPFGRFDRLDLLRPFPPESGDLSAPAGRAADGRPALRLDTTFSDGKVVVPVQYRTFGVVYAATDVVADAPTTVRLVAASPTSFALFVDGARALLVDRTRSHPPEAPAVRATLSAGRHRLLAKIANSGRFTPFILYVEPATPGAATGVRSAPVQGAADGTATVAPWPAPLDDPPAIDAATPPATAFAAVAWLRARGLDERLGAALQQLRSTWPKAPLVAAMFGEWSLAARTGKSVEEDLAKARTLLGEAVKGDPRLLRARLLIARMDEDAGQLKEAWQGTEEALAAAPDDPESLLAQFRVAMKRGWFPEAERRIDRARALAPGRSDFLDAAIDLYRKYGAQRKLGEALAAKFARDPLEEGWPDFLVAAGRADEARAAWRAMIANRPSYLYPRLGLARVEVDQGDPAAALAALDDAARLFPDEAFIPYRRAAVLSLRGDDDAAGTELKRTLELEPSRIAIWESLTRRGVADPLRPWLGDAEQILKDASRPTTGVDSALLADVASTFIDRQGGQTELYQGIHAVYTRAGVEREGELEIQPGARLQGLRIHKQDGRYADVAAGEKRPVNLPGLEPGDAVEYVWRRYIDPYGGIPGSLDNRTLFLFQGEDREYNFSRYVIAHDKDLPVEVCGNMRGLTTTDETKGGLRVRSWTARRMPRLAAEPHIADQLEVVPNIRLGLGETWADLGSLVKSGLAGMLVPDAPLPALADEVRKRAGNGGPDALARALHAVVTEKIRPGGAPLAMGVPASVSASAGEGNRAAVALALAQMLGLDARLVLARPIEYKGRQLDCPSPGAFGYALVKIVAGGNERYLDYGEADYPFDAFPARLAGADGLEIPLALDAPATIVAIPRRETGPVEESDADLTLDAEGRVSGVVTTTTRGALGAVLRRMLREVPVDQRPNVFRQLAGDAFPGASVDDSELTGLDDPEADLRIQLKISGGSWGRRTPTGFALPLVSRPLKLLAEYASLQQRVSALLIDTQEQRRDEIRLHYPEGLAPVESPAPAARGEKFGGYALLVKRQPNTITTVRQVNMPPGRIEPADYPLFRSFAQFVDDAESREVILAVPSPSLNR